MIGRLISVVSRWLCSRRGHHWWSDDLAGFVDLVLASYNARHKTNFTNKDVTQWDIPAALGIPAAELYADVKPGFCSQIPVYTGALKALNLMRKVADVVCLTAGWDAVDTWDGERREWLVKHCGFKKNDIIFAAGERKNLVSGDLFFDDKFSSVDSWSKANPIGKGILFSQPWNRNDFTNDRVSSLHMMAATTMIAAGKD